MKVLKIMIPLLSLILFTSCSQKTKYVKTPCKYIEPISVNITTNSVGGLDPSETIKVYKALKYYGEETKQLKVDVLKNNET